MNVDRVIGWSDDILTAPRDGSIIIGRDEYGIVFTCRWYSREEIAEWNGSDDPNSWDGAWYENDDADDEVCPIAWQSMEN